MENKQVQFNQVDVSGLNLGKLSIQTYWPDSTDAKEPIITIHDTRTNHNGAWGDKVFEGTLAQLIELLANGIRPSEYSYKMG